MRCALKLLIVLLIPAFLLGGCGGLTESDLVLLDQTRQAGEIAAADKAAAAETRQAGADVTANMERLQEEYGGPDVPVSYTPAAAEAAREENAVRHRDPPAALGWIKTMLRIVPGGDVAFPILAGVYGLFETVRRQKIVKRLRGVYHSVETAKTEVGEGKFREAFETAMAKAQEARGIAADVRGDLAAIGLAKKKA